MSNLEKPIFFFRELEKPGTVNLFMTLKVGKDLIAKNEKPYLRLVLIDPSSREYAVQIWGDNDLYAPLEEFMEQNNLKFDGPILLNALMFDGEFVSSTNKTSVDPKPMKHPFYDKYLKLNNYRRLKEIPDDPKILSEIHKILTTKPLIESIITRLDGEGVKKTDDLLWEVSKLVCDKTYTGTIHLILDSPQLEIIPEYMNYVLRQLEVLLKAFGEDISKETIAPMLLIRRLSKDLISLYEFTQMHQK